MQEVRSGGSYISQSDLRVHFGLKKATTADLEVHWPSRQIDKIEGVKANRVIRVVEDKGSVSGHRLRARPGGKLRREQ